MSEGIVVALISAGVVVVGAIAGVVSAIITAQVQAKRNSADVKLARIQSLEGRVDALEARDRIHQDYIVDLRQHILTGQPPPPPDWPTYP